MAKDATSTPCYAARDRDCGCRVAATIDDKNSQQHLQDMAKFCDMAIRDGLIIERTNVADVRNDFGHKCGKQNGTRAVSLAVMTPGLKLWRAFCEIEVFIASDLEPDEHEIKQSARYEADDSSEAFRVIGVRIVRELKEIPEDWQDSLPRGEETDLNCQQIVEQYLDARDKQLASQPMPNQTAMKFATDTEGTDAK